MHRVSCLPHVRADHKCASILPGGFCTVQEEEEEEEEESCRENIIPELVMLL